MNKKALIIPIILALAVSIAIILGAIFGLARKEANEESTEQPAVATTTPAILENIDTSHWETYRNEEFGFEFKHPSDWEMIKLPDAKAGLALKSPTYKPLISGNIVFSGEIYLSKIPNLDNLKIIDLINTFDDETRFWLNKFKYEEPIISGRDALIFPFAEDEYKRKEVFIKLEKNVFAASYIYDIKNPDIEIIFDNIVNNLKFY